MVDEVRQRLEESGVGIELTEAAKAALVKEGFDPVYGARPLRRTVQRRIENQLSKRILSGEFHEGDRVVADYADGEYVFEKQGVAAPVAS